MQGAGDTSGLGIASNLDIRQLGPKILSLHRIYTFEGKFEIPANHFIYRTEPPHPFIPERDTFHALDFLQMLQHGWCAAFQGVHNLPKAEKTSKYFYPSCDLRQPSCSQCERLGLECAGYAKQRIFLNTTNTHPAAVSYKSAAAVTAETTTITLPDTLARSASESRLVGNFWSAYLPNGRKLSSGAVQDTLGGWTNTIQELYNTDDTLKKAVLALCLASSGRIEGVQWMSKEALRVYVSALQEMKAALKRQSKTKQDAILTTARVFSLYEALHGADDQNESAQAISWKAHISGELAILIERGPHEFRQGHAHNLFIYGRLHLTVLAIRSRKKSVLSNPEWKTIPWECHPKSQKDKLLDILTEIPTLLEESDILSRSSSDETQEEKDRRRQRLIQHCWLCDKHLTRWHEAMTVHTRKHSRPFNNARQSILIDTTELGSAHLMTLYWSTCVLLYRVLRQAVGPDIQLPKRVNDIKGYCQKIVRALPIFFHPAVGAFRAYLSTFPMYIVISHLYVFGEDEKKAELKLMEDCYKTTEGITIGRFMKSVGHHVEANNS
ncbi:hypothetical protein PISL3812_03050 [Talaromyces islandicus]|uniref:Uncharacterized protein n=1 Tax=Talaromyces islandicus TaxID=28573 RepID=A0A0U1LRL6_TALIS|nr:hypothetical protein PISL3812_03050 [Talaromyces islandicus]